MSLNTEMHQIISKMNVESPNLLFRVNCDSSKIYEIFFFCNHLNLNHPHIAQLLINRKALLVTTPTVHKLYREIISDLKRQHNLDIQTIILNCNEESKSIELVEEVCKMSLKYDLKRQDTLISMGGGICSDIVTVAASIIRRGINHIRIPTTLIGQIDAGIGIKGAVNFMGKKSYLGCFYPPSAVVINQVFLETLPINHLRNGLAEIIKIAVIKDSELFDILETNLLTLISSGFQKPKITSERVIYLAIRGMIEELKTNLYEDQTYKRLVDFGHTFSPIIESSSNFAVSHGEAVAIDVALSSTISSQIGLLSEKEHSRIISAIKSASLPIFSKFLTYESGMKALVEAANHRGGEVNLVLPTRIGNGTFLQTCDLPPQILKTSIVKLSRL